MVWKWHSQSIMYTQGRIETLRSWTKKGCFFVFFLCHRSSSRSCWSSWWLRSRWARGVGRTAASWSVCCARTRADRCTTTAAPPTAATHSTSTERPHSTTSNDRCDCHLFFTYPQTCVNTHFPFLVESILWVHPCELKPLCVRVCTLVSSDKLMFQFNRVEENTTR